MHGLSKNVEVQIVGDPVANGSSTDNNSTRIDMSEYESVMFIAPITDSTATGVATITIEENSADSDSGMAAVTGTSATVTCATTDDINGTALITEVYKPSSRYVQLVRTSATANIAFGSVVAVLVPKRLPATQGATVSSTGFAAN